MAVFKRNLGKNRRRRGSAMMEFALVGPFLMGLLVGSFVIGLGMVKALQVQQVVRNAGILFMKFIDMSASSNQDIVVRTASGLNMQRSGGGNGLIVLSQVLYVGVNECAAGGLSQGACPNYNQYVFTKRIYIGNQALTSPTTGASLQSRLGNPRAGIVQADGSITTNDYLTDGTARLTSFPMVLNYGEFTFVSEGWFTMPELYFPKWQLFLDHSASPVTYNDNTAYSIYLT